METDLSVLPKFPKQPYQEDRRCVADAYNDAGERYQNYADGDLKKLYAFEGPHSYADRQTWAAIELRLHHLRLSGARNLRVLDLGCGPGTWMRRVITRAHQMGFTQITARGIDVSEFQIYRARTLSRALSDLGEVHLSYDVGDIRLRFVEDDKSVDLCLCLYGVLNHVAIAELRPLMREVARVTKGWFISTVRAVGSTPTVYVESMYMARNFVQDHLVDRLDVDFQDGRYTSFNSHLFSHTEVKGLVRPYLKLEELKGLDLFHNRFASDPRWNPKGVESVAFTKELNLLEERYNCDPEFMDHATHLLMVARSQEPIAYIS